MATYTELWDIARNADNNTLRNKVAVAVAIKAHALLNLVSPTPGQVAWANSALENPSSQVDVVLFYMLADNAGVSVAAITGAADTVIQSAANDAIDALVA